MRCNLLYTRAPWQRSTRFFPVLPSLHHHIEQNVHAFSLLLLLFTQYKKTSHNKTMRTRHTNTRYLHTAPHSTPLGNSLYSSLYNHPSAPFVIPFRIRLSVPIKSQFRVYLKTPFRIICLGIPLLYLPLE